jgi:lysophospholipase L1-like esterase
MVKPVINTFSQFAPLLVETYERYLPTAYDESLSLLQKVNKIIQYVNSTSDVLNGVITQWDSVMDWVMNDGLTQDVNDKLDSMVTDGTFDSFINGTVFGGFNTRLGNLETDKTNTNTTISDLTNRLSVIEDVDKSIKTKDRFSLFSHVTSDRKTINIIGDSISEGTATTNFVTDAYTGIIRKAFNNEWQNSNYGFCNFNTYIVDSSVANISSFHKITRNGFNVYGQPLEPAVFGGTRIKSNTVNDYVDIDYTGKDAIVVYVPDTGMLEVSVDGVVVGTINTTTVNQSTKGSLSPQITVSTFGKHTIRLRNTNGGNVTLCGMIYLDDANVISPTFNNYGVSSVSACQIPDDILDLYASSGMVVLALGVNDQNYNNDVTQFKAKLTRVCDKVVSQNGSLVLCDFMFSLPSDDAYKKAISDVYKNYPQFVYLDFAQLWLQDSNSNKNINLLNEDGVHPTKEGHEFIANTILKYIGLPYTKGMLNQLNSFEFTKRQALSLQNSWIAYGNAGVQSQPKVYKDKEGKVHFEGMLKNVGAVPQWSVIAKVPIGYEPIEDVFTNSYGQWFWTGNYN